MQAFIALFLGMSALSTASVSNLPADMSLVRNINPSSLAAEVPSIVNSFLDRDRTAQQSSATHTDTITVVDADPSLYTLSHPTPSPGDALTTTTVTPLGGKFFPSPASSPSGSGIASPVVPWAPHPHLERITRTAFNGSVYTITRVDEGSTTKTVSEVTLNGTTFMVSGMPTSSSLTPVATATDTTTDTVTALSTVTPSPVPSVPTVASTTITDYITTTVTESPVVTANPISRPAVYQCINDVLVSSAGLPHDLGYFAAFGAPMDLNLGNLGNSSYHPSFNANPQDPRHFTSDPSEIEGLKARCANGNLPMRETFRVLWSALMPGGTDDYDYTRTVTVTGSLRNMGGSWHAVPEKEARDWDTTATATLVADHSTLYTISSSKGTYGTEKYELFTREPLITKTISVVELPHTTLTRKHYHSEGGFLHTYRHDVEAYVDQESCEKVVEVVDIGYCGGKHYGVPINTITQVPAARAPICKKPKLVVGKARKSCASEWCMYQHQKPMMITTVQSAYVQKGPGPESHWANITQHYLETLPHWGKTKDKLIYWPFSITSTTHKRHTSTFAALDSDYSARSHDPFIAPAPKCWDRETCSAVCHNRAFSHTGWLHGFNFFWLLAAILAILLIPICCCCCCLPWCRRRRQAREKQQGVEAGQQVGEAVVVTTSGGGGGGGAGGQAGETVVTTTTADGGKKVEKVSGPAEVVTTSGGGGQGGNGTVVTSVEEKPKGSNLMEKLARRKTEMV